MYSNHRITSGTLSVKILARDGVFSSPILPIHDARRLARSIDCIGNYDLSCRPCDAPQDQDSMALGVPRLPWPQPDAQAGYG